MDASQYMIVDLAHKGNPSKLFITEQVRSITMNRNGHWTILFHKSKRPFQYNRARLLYLSHPEVIDLEEKGLYINYKRITNATEVLRFTHRQHTYYRVSYDNGEIKCMEDKNVYITRTPINQHGGSLWEYLQTLVLETGLCTDEGDNILAMQYEHIDMKRDNVPLAQYLGDPTPLATYKQPRHIFYPFGCNASQKAAVEAALTHQVSIIQGPPGTGKTQTILNIISNLLMANKSVLVVSNNNSAVMNVAEKLEQLGLGFLVAKLGRSENKKVFIEEQLKDYPDMSSWQLCNADDVTRQAHEALETLTRGFDGQIRSAQLKAEHDALVTEQKYNDLLNNTPSDEYHWLLSKPSKGLIKLLSLCSMMQEQKRSPSFWFRLRWMPTLGLKALSFLKQDLSLIIPTLEHAYYHVRKREIEHELAKISALLETIDIKQNIQDLSTASLRIFKHKVSNRYSSGSRPHFSLREIKSKSEEFLREYPIVLSTTYSAKNCIDKDMVFDYVIMDEASQVDITTGALALSCAMNAVIVGDSKQLPNVISREEKQAIQVIQTAFHVDDRYNALMHSFLTSCIDVFAEAPTTLLREHYRCHPKIIEFCNQRFYDNQLITMTTNMGQEEAIRVVQTVKGNHARNKFNQREIDVITQEILPQYADKGSIGIITPYHNQAQAINRIIGEDIASTVHKYQGRECDTIIMSTVDSSPTAFSDDPNLLNVAISRAKAHLCIVTSGNDIPPSSNLSQLISYIRYNNFEIRQSQLNSVFDLLYQQYTHERLAYQASHPSVSEYLSESLIYNTIVQALSEPSLSTLSVVCHYPLYRLISDWSLLSDEELAFAHNPLTHVDFLIYSSISKRPLLSIEVDGWHFHQENEVQQARDVLKDQIFAKYALPLERLSTTDIVTTETMRTLLLRSISTPQLQQ